MKHSFVKVIGYSDVRAFEQEINQTIETSEELGCRLHDIKFSIEPENPDDEYSRTNLWALLIFDTTE